MSSRLLAAGAVAGLTMGAAQASEVSRSIDVQAPASAVWTTIGDFCGIGRWHPAIETCAPSDKDGRKFRTLALKGGGTILERLESWDDAARSYSYTILESPLPVENYRSTISVTEKGANAATVTWSSSFAPKGPEADAKKVIDGIYEAGLQGIKGKI